MDYIDQLGVGLEGMEQQILDNYNINFSTEVINKTVIRLINQIWKLIPMRENNENWKKQLNTIIIEVTGLSVIFKDNVLFLQLLSKLEGLNNVEIEFDLYRKTIFELISLLQELKK